MESIPKSRFVSVTAGGVTVEIVTTVEVTDKHEHADEYLAAPLQDAAYAGIVPGVGDGRGVVVGVSRG